MSVRWAGLPPSTNQRAGFATWRRNSPPTLGLSALTDGYQDNTAALHQASGGSRVMTSGRAILFQIKSFFKSHAGFIAQQ